MIVAGQPVSGAASFPLYLVALTHVAGFTILLGGGLAVATLRMITRRAPEAKGFFEGANRGLILFFWTGLVLVIGSGVLMQVWETGTFVPDPSTPRGLLLWLKGVLLMPVLAKSILVTYYAIRRPGGRTYPPLRGVARAAFIAYDLVLVMVIVMLGVLIESI